MIYTHLKYLHGKLSRGEKLGFTKKHVKAEKILKTIGNNENNKTQEMQ